jgi:hypothetical protein
MSISHGQLAPNVEGIRVQCLKCDSTFLSRDSRRNRLCQRCNTENDFLLRFYTPEALGIGRRTLAMPARRLRSCGFD